MLIALLPSIVLSFLSPSIFSAPTYVVHAKRMSNVLVHSVVPNYVNGFKHFPSLSLFIFVSFLLLCDAKVSGYLLPADFIRFLEMRKVVSLFSVRTSRKWQQQQQQQQQQEQQLELVSPPSASRTV